MNPPTIQELEAAAVDVAYEFKMFGRAWDLYCNGVPSGHIQASQPLGHNDSAINTPFTFAIHISTPTKMRQPQGEFIFLEGLLLHMRVLVDFFFEKNRTNDNVLATDYSGKAQLLDPVWLFDFKQRCNKLVVHLAYKRSGHRSKDEHHWSDIEDLVHSMNTTISEFLASLPPERREWFKEQGV